MTTIAPVLHIVTHDAVLLRADFQDTASAVLRAGGPERRLKADFAVLLTVKTMRFLYDQGRRIWIVL